MALRKWMILLVLPAAVGTDASAQQYAPGFVDPQPALRA
jgi:hypothetical protein